MLIDKLSTEELDMMDNYRKANVWNYEAYSRSNEYAPMKSILNEWAMRKSEYLEKLFDGNLILSKRVAYTKSYEELQDELSDMMQEYASYGRAGRNGWEFTKAWNEYMYRNHRFFTDEQNEGLHRLMSDDCLISNIYDGSSFEIETPSGKPFKVNRNCKTSKALGKLATIFDLPGFEDFRICHSQILNQKDLGGVLTISIHPLDYMTMSDNSYEWESCMSWEREGSYRQGTVEMMNSRSVIVAYLAGEETFHVGEGDWNSKKWRQLFVVDHNIIAGVKDYPYHNANLGFEVVRWLKDLVAEKLNWHYEDIQAFDFNSGKIHLDYLPDEKNNFNLDFYTNNMYNDFGCLDSHWICISNDIDPEEIKTSGEAEWRRAWLPIDYSGCSQCMVCGELDPELEDESCLACENCQDRRRCDCCGEVSEEVWEVDGIRLCPYCWDNRTHECSACGEVHYDENMIPIYVIPRLDEKAQDKLRDAFMENNSYWSCSFCNTVEDLKVAEYNFFNEMTDIWICEDGSCMEKWIKKYLKPGERPHKREIRWSTEVFVYYDQLTEEGQDEFAWGYDGNNEAFANSFRLSSVNPTRFIELL